MRPSPRFLLFLAAIALGSLTFFGSVTAQDKKDVKKDEKKEEKKVEEKKPEPFVPDKAQVEFKGHGDWINDVVFSADGKTILSASRDRTAKTWDLLGKNLQTLKGHAENVKAAAFVGDKIATSAGKWNKEKKAWEGEIKLWAGDKQAASLKGHDQTIESIAVSKDGKTLVTGSEDQTILVWDVAAAKPSQTLKGHTGAVLAVAVSSDGKKVASTSRDRSIKIWDVASAKDVATMKVEIEKKVEPKKEEPKKTDPKKADLKKADPKKADPKAAAPGKEPSREFVSLAFSPDGSKLAAGNLDGMVKIYDAADGKEIGELIGHEGVWALAFGPDGSKLATGGWDQTIKVWDIASKKDVQTIKAHMGTVTTLDFSPDGSLIASGGTDNLVKIWAVKK
ncbi:MAG: WD40 repeat domain-containing protein [Gemmataceae bacterium]|nr:WD40 repeat domain-containing protein [Gemmataceae bacterium]